MNSDILSSIEKSNVQVEIKDNIKDKECRSHLIKRKERNLDAEELLYLVLKSEDSEIIDFLQESNTPFFSRINARISMLDKHSLLV